MRTPVWLRSAIILLFSVTACAIAMLVIVASVWQFFVNGVTSTPEAIQNWGGVIMGFFFGSFLTLMSEWLFERG